MPLVTVRGTAQVFWKPDYTLVLSSVDGLSLDSDGKLHLLIATLTHTSSGLPVSSTLVRLATDPRGRRGDRSQHFTDGSGLVTFTVSDNDDESVEYTAFVPGKGIEASLTIQWGSSNQWYLLFPAGPGTIDIGDQSIAAFPSGYPWGSPWFQLLGPGGIGVDPSDLYGFVSVNWTGNRDGSGFISGSTSYDSFSATWVSDTGVFLTNSGPGVALYSVLDIELPPGVAYDPIGEMPGGQVVRINWVA